MRKRGLASTDIVAPVKVLVWQASRRGIKYEFSTIRQRLAPVLSPFSQRAPNYISNCRLYRNVEKCKDFDFSLEGLLPGLYFLEITSEDKRAIEPIVIE